MTLDISENLASLHMPAFPTYTILCARDLNHLILAFFNQYKKQHIVFLKLWPADYLNQNQLRWDFPGGAELKNPPDNAANMGSSPGLGRSHMPRSN